MWTNLVQSTENVDDTIQGVPWHDRPDESIMKILLTLLILAVVPPAPNAAAEAPEVFHCQFGESWDQNYDDWPDGWSRRRGKGYPEYISVKIVPADDALSAGKCLQVDLDGGAAIAYSPPIRVTPLHSYVLQGAIDTSGLEFDQAFLSLTLLDENRERLETYRSEQVSHRPGWNTLKLGPIEPRHEEIRLAVLGLHVLPGKKADLKGRVRFDEILLTRMPRITMAMPNAHHLFTDPSEMVVDCRVSGINHENQNVKLILEDALGNRLAQAERKLETTTAPGSYSASMDSEAEPLPALVGTVRWQPPIASQGFYRMLAELTGHEGPVHLQDVTAAVIQPQPDSASGEFGWTLPDRGQPLDLFDLSKVITQAGIGWVKFPLWLGPDADEEMMQELIRFGERLSVHGIQIVGLLSDPPPEVLEHFRDVDPLSAAVIFSAADQIWYPSVKPTMIRMATQVRWWQFGADADTGFVDYPNLAEKAAALKAKLDEVGYGVNVGFGWGWLNELPAEKKVPWQFMALSSSTPLTQQELPVYLDAVKLPNVRRWVVLNPLDKREYSMETRIHDLVHRMITAKIHGAEGIFVPDPVDDQQGLLREDGGPSELFLPWRTTAIMLASAKYAGSIQLPGGSENRIFLRDGNAVMVVWNDNPTEEVLYLGEDVRRTDLWGVETVPGLDHHRHVIQVDKTPVFVTGLNPAIVKWRQQFAFDEPQIPSIFGRQYNNGFQVQNTFGHAVSVTARLAMPDVWKVTPPEAFFRLETDQAHHQGFDIFLPYDATSGAHDVRCDFEIHSQQPIRFSAYRRMHVGLGGIRVEVQTRLNADGDLEVEQHFINDTDESVSFRCYLYVPNRRRQKLDILDLGHGRDVQRFRLQDGKELIGQTLWLKADEIGGGRGLNHQFQAQP